MRIAVGSGERTYLTDVVIEELKKRGHEVLPFGPLAGEDLEWAEVGLKVAEAVARGSATRGSSSAGPGQGCRSPPTRSPGSGRPCVWTPRRPAGQAVEPRQRPRHELEAHLRDRGERDPGRLVLHSVRERRIRPA